MLTFVGNIMLQGGHEENFFFLLGIHILDSVLQIRNKADVTKAHRRIQILLQEWRYQVAQLGDEWWVNTVGTYGMASAQLLPSF